MSFLVDIGSEDAIRDEGRISKHEIQFQLSRQVDMVFMPRQSCDRSDVRKLPMRRQRRTTYLGIYLFFLGQNRILMYVIDSNPDR